MNALTKQTNKGHTYFQWIFAILSSFILMLYGMDFGWVSPIAKYLQSDESPAGYPMSDDEVAWIACTPSMAAIFGVPLCAFVADRYGRKMSIILIAALQALSWIIRLSYTSFLTVIIARICAGLGAGGCYGVVPMYIKEISQEDLRGILGTLPTLFQTIGLFIIYALGAYLDYNTVIYAVLGLPILTILVMIKAPESPEFLVKQDKTDEAVKTLAYLRGLEKDDPLVQSIVETIVNQEAHFKSLPEITLLSILKNKSWSRGLLYSVLAVTFFEANGAYSIVTYASSILTSTGVKFGISPEIQSLSLPIVMILGSVMLTLCVEKYGRKTLLTGAFLVTSVSMFTLAVIVIIQKEVGDVPSWLPVLGMMLVVAMYSGGICPVTFIILTEMFNFQIRAKVMGSIVTYNWLMGFIILRIYTPLSNDLGAFAPFVFYGTANLAGALFTIFCLTETKGKTEEEVLEALANGKKIRSPNSVDISTIDATVKI